MFKVFEKDNQDNHWYFVFLDDRDCFLWLDKVLEAIHDADESKPNL